MLLSILQFRLTTLIVQRVSFLKKIGIQHSTDSEIHSLASTR